MPRKLTEFQKFIRQAKIEYKLKVQYLMDAVSGSPVRKQTRTFKSADGDIARITNWVVGKKYVVDCFGHTVYTIEAFDAQKLYMFLKCCEVEEPLELVKCSFCLSC